MQLATQRQFNEVPEQPQSKKPAPAKKSARAGTIAAIHITWAKLRRDLKGDKEALREQRLAFMSRVLNRDVKSSRDLTQAKLGKVLDAMRALEQAPLLPGAALVQSPKSKVQSPEAGGEIHHLATVAQGDAIDKIFAHLRWSLEAREGFIEKRFKTKSHRMLTPDQANKLTMILLTIAASRDIKDRSGVMRVSRRMIGAEIPALKRRLGIDQQRSEVGSQRSDEEEEEWS